MHIPHDIVNLVIDQLVFEAADAALVTSRPYGAWRYPRSLAQDLRATSLVNTLWSHHSQHYLFSSVTLYREAHVQQWCSRIRPGAEGVSRHVRTLKLGPQTLRSDIFKTALPHLMSFSNLQELIMCHSRTSDTSHVSLDILTPIFSSFAATLKRLRWSNAITDNAWKILYPLTNLLPNLVDIELSGCGLDRRFIRPSAHPRIHLSLPFGDQSPNLMAFKHFKFQELSIMAPISQSPQFLKYCCTSLRVLDFVGTQYSCVSHCHQHWMDPYPLSQVMTKTSRHCLKCVMHSKRSLSDSAH